MKLKRWTCGQLKKGCPQKIGIYAEMGSYGRTINRGFAFVKYSNCSREDRFGEGEGSDQDWRQTKVCVDLCGNLGKKGWGINLKI